MSTYKPGDTVYYKTYLAQILAVSDTTLFTNTQKYLIDPYPDQMRRRIVKETKLLPAHLRNIKQKPQSKEQQTNE